jgi:hypothetical protein
MSIWKRIEQAVWTGTVIKDYGPLAQGEYGRATRTVSAMLTRRDSGDRFIVRASYKAFLAASVHYIELDRGGGSETQSCARRRGGPDDGREGMRERPNNEMQA